MIVKEVVAQVGEVLEQQILPQIAALETKMATKSFLEDRIADEKGEVVVLVRKEDKKLDTSLDVLQQREALTVEDVRQIKREHAVFPVYPPTVQ